MNKEQDSLSVTYERARKVFGSTKVPRQMEAGYDMLLEAALQRNKPNPVPEIEIVRIYEMGDT